MVIIKFPDGSEWFKANWAFRRLAEDVAAAFPQNKDLISQMERAQGIGALFLSDLEVPLLTATLKAIRSVAKGTVDGVVQGWKRTHPKDESGQQQYVDSMKELLDLIDKHSAR